MPASPLYLRARARLAQHLPQALASQLETLGAVLVGVIQRMSRQLANIARAMPRDTTALAKEQRWRRWLENARVTQATHYHPLVQQARHGLRGQRDHGLLDRVRLRNQHPILAVSAGFRRRSIPLVWRAVPQRGSRNLQEQPERMQTAAALAPPDVRIGVHGESAFRSQALRTWVRAQGDDAMRGICGQTWVYERAALHADGQPLAERVAPLPPQTAWGRKRPHRPSPVTSLAQVSLGQEARLGPVNVVAWRERDDDGTVALHAGMTNLPATAQTKAAGKRRMWIETVVCDWQRGGFHLDAYGLTDTDRVVRLRLVLAIASLWLVSLGCWVVKRG